jgi:hypothetical protein
VAVCSVSVGTANAQHVAAVTELIAKDIAPFCVDAHSILTLNYDLWNDGVRIYVPGHASKKFTDDFKSFVSAKHCIALAKGTTAGFNEGWQTVKIVEMSGAIIILKNGVTVTARRICGAPTVRFALRLCLDDHRRASKTEYADMHPPLRRTAFACNVHRPAVAVAIDFCIFGGQEIEERWSVQR